MSTEFVLTLSIKLMRYEVNNDNIQNTQMPFIIRLSAIACLKWQVNAFNENILFLYDILNGTVTLKKIKRLIKELN